MNRAFQQARADVVLAHDALLALMGIGQPSIQQHAGALLVAEGLLRIIHRRGLI